MAEEEKKEVKEEKPQGNKPKPPLPPGFPSSKNFKKFNFYWIWGILLVVFIGMQFLNWNGETNKIDWGKLKSMIQAKDVQKIILVNNQYAEIYIKKDRLATDKYKLVQKTAKNTFGETSPQYIYTPVSAESFLADIKDIQKNVDEKEMIYITPETRKNWGGDILSWVFPILFFVVAWFIIMRLMSRGSGGGGGGSFFNIGKSKAQLYDKDTTVTINFGDVAGLEEAKVEVMEIVDFLKNPSKYTNLGGKIPKGALLVGPPGTGKTLLAKAVAGEAKVPFFSISGSDFVEMFVGVGASRVRDLFKQAKEKAPCIIFIDEIDAIGRARGRNAMTGANDERENTLNQLLTEMDGFATNAGVIILAATNRADILDRALMRAGRFDRQIHVELPDLEERKAIFHVHAKPLKIDNSVNIEFLSKQTPGFSGADIANVCNESALIAARKGKKFIDKQDFMDAIDRIVGGLEKKNKIISMHEKTVIAFHEAGHAAVSWLLEFAHPLVKVTIVPRGKALGAAWYLPDERQITTYEQMVDEITAALGGRASEEIQFGKISTGALNDLEKVFKQAYAMVVFFGLNKKLGNISFYDSTGQQDYSFTKPFSEHTAQIIDEEISNLIENAYSRAKELLTANKEKLAQLAEILLKKEVIFREDLEKIFGPRQWEEEKMLIEGENGNGNKLPENNTTITLNVSNSDQQSADERTDDQQTDNQSKTKK